MNLGLFLDFLLDSTDLSDLSIPALVSHSFIECSLIM